MRFLAPIRSRAFSLPALFLGVGLCVFAWGLRYKLSLYDPPHSASRNIPTAKLLSKDELPEMLRPVGLAADAATFADLLVLSHTPSGPTRAALLIAPCAQETPLPLLPVAPILQSHGLQSFFVRPPPARS